jgi:methylated-DNA-[protein]-cysteine S-methyltransferase
MTHWTVIAPASDTKLYVGAGDGGICHISFTNEIPSGWTRNDRHPLLREAARQLTRYFEGRLQEFELPLEMSGTPFQRKVWDTLLGIPYGEVISYAQLAGRVGSPRGFRAVGAANGKNPIPIIVPCHRVINTGGGLGGYSCGLPYKRRLLELEGVKVDVLRQLSFAASV